MVAEETSGQPGVVETLDGTQHDGVLPASAAVPDTRVSVPGEPAGQRTTGWYRSRAGVLSHADGPSQAAAYVSLGYTPVEEADALAEIGDGIELAVDRRDATGTFDDDAVTKAVADEGSLARSAAARKGAETKRRKKAAAERAARTAANDESDAVGAGD